VRNKTLDSVTNLTEDEKKAVRLLKKSVEIELGVSRVILFGSKARGNYNEDSDIDVMILVDSNLSYLELSNKVSDIELQVISIVDVPLMSKVESLHDWGTSSSVWKSLKLRIDKDGIELEF
jgi:predicted nucleotidyltransferase